MAKQKYRIVATRFWKDKTIRRLDPLEKELYLYLLTNDQTTMCGIYQTTLDEMAHDTGLDYRQIPLILEKFAGMGIAGFYDDEWVVIPNYMKHQNMDNEKVRAGVKADMESLPEAVREYTLSIGYRYPMHTLSTTTTTTSTTKEDTPRYQNLVAKYGKKAVDEYIERVKLADDSGSLKRRVKDVVATAGVWLSRALEKGEITVAVGYGVKATVKLPTCACGGKLKEYEPGSAMCENRDSEWRLLNDLWVEVGDD